MQTKTSLPSPESGKEVAKQIDPLTSGASRFSPHFWLSRIYRPRYTRDGKSQQVAEWYARLQHGGRREAVGLGTNTREEASRRAARLYQTLRAKGWDAALVEFRPVVAHRSGLSVGEFLAAVRPLLKVRARTFEVYSYALRKIAVESTGRRDAGKDRFHPTDLSWRKRADDLPLIRLTAREVETWKADFISQASASPLAAQRARRSVNSYVRNARALFGRRVLKRLAELSISLPDPLPFLGVELERGGSTRYVSTIDAAEILRLAREELSASDADAWLVILLALGAGLRRGEIDGLCWTQIDITRAEIRIANHEHFEAKTDDSTGSVFIDKTLADELRRHFAAESLFVIEPHTLPSKTKSAQAYRCAATLNRATAWLRKNGVLAQKPLHTLRKEFGSMITAQADIHTASRQLRHSTIATTAAYYADHRRRATVDVGGLLDAKAK